MNRTNLILLPTLADVLFAEAFSTRPRGKRSHAYKRGVLAALKYRLEAEPIREPYTSGSAEADAFFSGTDEGHQIWRSYIDEQKGAENAPV